MTTQQKLLVVAGEDVEMRLATFIHLRSVGFDLAIVAPVKHQALTKAGISVFHYDLNRNIHPLDDWRAIRQLRNITRAWKPHIVLAYDPKPSS